MCKITKTNRALNSFYGECVRASINTIKSTTLNEKHKLLIFKNLLKLQPHFNKEINLLVLIYNNIHKCQLCCNHLSVGTVILDIQSVNKINLNESWLLSRRKVKLNLIKNICSIKYIIVQYMIKYVKKYLPIWNSINVCLLSSTSIIFLIKQYTKIHFQNLMR